MGVWEPEAVNVPEGKESVREGLRAVTCILSSGSSVFMANISRA